MYYQDDIPNIPIQNNMINTCRHTSPQNVCTLSGKKRRLLPQRPRRDSAMKRPPGVPARGSIWGVPLYWLVYRASIIK